MSGSVIVVGGGHNGLVSAALLAKAGRQVIVLERRSCFGGLAAREEFHPGFQSPGVHLESAQWRGWVAKDLALEQHGLRWRDSEPAWVAPAPDGPGVRIFPGDVAATVRELGELGEQDAAAYERWQALLGRLSVFLGAALNGPAPDLEPHGLPGLWELARTGLALRLLGRADMSELLRVGPMCVADWLNENFHDPRLKLLLALPAVSGGWVGPWSAGTAFQLLSAESTRARSVLGGPAAAVDALVSCASSHGVELRADAAVIDLIVRDGRVRGVRLESGETLDAAVVLSSCDPRNTLLDMIDKRELPPVLETRALAWRTRGTTAVVRLALSGPLVFRGRPDELVERAVLGSDLDGLERAFDPVKYGELPDAPCLELSVPSLSSPELAPDGQHVVCIQVHFVPHALQGGWSDARRDDLKQRVLSTLARFAENIPEQILGCEVLHPVDIEQRYGNTGGHIHHGEQALDQALHQRPNPECSRHATPVAGLFLCGSGTHPGGGLTGAPGALAARAVLEAGS